MVTLFTGHVFIIDTNKYAGNFERQMCAFITGQIGDCGVGGEEADIASRELDKDILEWFEWRIEKVIDEHGCARPTTIWPNPSYFNDGRGNEWPVVGYDEELVKKTYFESVNKTLSKEIIRNAKIIKGNPEKHGYLMKAIRSHGKAIAWARKGKYGRYPSYSSVAIFLDTIPPDNVLKTMKERAKKYASEKGIELERFWLVTFKQKKKKC